FDGVVKAKRITLRPRRARSCIPNLIQLRATGKRPKQPWRRLEELGKGVTLEERQLVAGKVVDTNIGCVPVKHVMSAPRVVVDAGSGIRNIGKRDVFQQSHGRRGEVLSRDNVARKWLAQGRVDDVPVGVVRVIDDLGTGTLQPSAEISAAFRRGGNDTGCRTAIFCPSALIIPKIKDLVF